MINEWSWKHTFQRLLTLKSFVIYFTFILKFCIKDKFIDWAFVALVIVTLAIRTFENVKIVTPFFTIDTTGKGQDNKEEKS